MEQVFISSTYIDLKEERQVAIDAVLKTGNRPIGMEQFLAGDKSQIDIIRDYLDKSDLFLLILGGRYGSIEPESGKSYIQLEYEYAKEKGIPMFSLVISESALLDKQKTLGYPNVMELSHQGYYEEFKKEVLNHICEFFDDVKDIKYSIALKLGEVTKNKLEKEIELLKVRGSKEISPNDNYDAIKFYLKNAKIKNAKNSKLQVDNVLDLLIEKQNEFIRGVQLSIAPFPQNILEEQAIPQLKKFGLVEEVFEGYWLKAKLTNLGYEFIRKYELEQFQAIKP